VSRFSSQLFLLLFVAILTACESTPTLQEEVAPVEDRTQREAAQATKKPVDRTVTSVQPERFDQQEKVLVYPDEDISMPALEPQQLAKAAPVPDKSATKSTQYKTGPAAQGLLNQASQLAREGKADQAEGMIERALRIEPSNPWLWHRLSVLKLQQSLYRQSIDLARKSNSLASGDSRLQSGNWQVIARASDKLGDTKTAREARNQAKVLSGH
jgi:predicted Zn-dependent protease